MGKTAKGFHCFAYLVLSNNSFRFCFLVHNSAFYAGKVLHRIGSLKGISLGVLNGDHNIPGILIALEIGFPGADAGKGKEALHEGEGQAGKNQRERGCPQGLFLCF